MGWLDCPVCHDILRDNLCCLCGDMPESPEYTATEYNHFHGPMCPECMERCEEAAGEMAP